MGKIEMEKSIHSSQDIPFYRDERIINRVTQTLSAVIVIGMVAWLLINFKAAADARG